MSIEVSAQETQTESIEMLINEEQVNRRINEMGAELARNYKTRDPIFVMLLHGAVPFAAKLMSAAVSHDSNFHPKVTTMIISRYGPNREPDQTTIVAPLPLKVRQMLTDRDVVFLDDLIDRGGTMETAQNYALENGAASAGGIVLARKQQHPNVTVPIEMVGFDNLPNEWLIGMGMNSENETYRWAGFIGIAKQLA